MNKGAQTRARAAALAAEVFNQRGYFATSTNDLVAATGLARGGIYNHFSGKADLAAAALDVALERVWEAALGAVAAVRAGGGDASDQLLAIVGTFALLADGTGDPEVAFDRRLRPAGSAANGATALPVPGGCPMVNTAVGVGHQVPELAGRITLALGQWQDLIRGIVAAGIAAGELIPAGDPDRIARLLLATVEGGLLFTRFTGDPAWLDDVILTARLLLDGLHVRTPPTGPSR